MYEKIPMLRCLKKLVSSDSISSFKRWKGESKVLGYLPSTYMYTIYFLSPFEIIDNTYRTFKI